MTEQNSAPLSGQTRLRREKILNEIEIICSILFDAQESLKIVDYLSADEEIADLFYTKRMNVFFYWTRISQWKAVIIDLYKLFWKNENFYIKEFLNRLGAEGASEAVIDQRSIENWISRIDACNPIIMKLRNQRNKSIAHKDREVLVNIEEFETINEISIGEVQKLIEIVQQVAREIYKVVKETDFMINRPIDSPVENLKWIITELTEKRLTDLRPLFAEAKKYGLQDELPQSEQ